MKKILVLGDSHAGAIKAGWDQFLVKNNPTFDLDFACLWNGNPRNNPAGGEFDQMLVSDSGLIHIRENFKKIWTKSSPPDLEDYDLFLIVTRLSVFDWRIFARSINQIPIYSGSLIEKIISSHCTRLHFNPFHPINYVLAKKKDSIVFLGRPLTSESGSGAYDQRSSFNHMRNIEKISSVIKKFPFKILCPTSEVLDKEMLSTRKEFFDSGTNFLGESHGRVGDITHANAKYGEILLKTLQQNIS